MDIFVFFCFSSPGSPVGTYSVTWRRVGKPMPGVVSVSGGVLTFPATRSEDSGQYYCVVGNEFGFMQELVTLYILCKQFENYFEVYVYLDPLLPVVLALPILPTHSLTPNPNPILILS